MKTRILFLLILFLIASGLVQTQTENNPFELPIPPEKSAIKTPKSIDLDNPFEIEGSSKKVIEVESKTNSTKDKAAGSIETGLAIFVMIFLAFLLTLFRGLFQDFFDSVFRDRKFNQTFRRMNSIWVIPNFLFYIFFAINSALFLFSLAKYLDFSTGQISIQYILTISGLITAFFLGKHLIIENLGRIFGIENETDRYSLVTMMFNVIFGVLITPLNILILLGPETIQGTAIIIGIVVIVLVYGLLIMRALSIANRYITQNTFHFFMYLCTIEIAPLFIIAKMMG